MNLSITIPQIFYDLIARVLPGFFFLLALKIVMSGSGLDLHIFGVAENSNFAASLGNGLGYFFLFYLVGWLLSSFKIFSFGKAVRDEHEKKWQKNNPSEDDKLTLSKMFQRLRIKNQEVGFRIVKLRAEAKMIECTRTAMGFVTLLVPVLFVLDKKGLLVFADVSMAVWLAKLIVPMLIFVALFRLERGAWNRCFGNISTLYEIVCGLHKSDVANLNDRRKSERRNISEVK